MSHAVLLARQGHLGLARELVRHIDRASVVRARKFKFMSEQGMALIGGLVLGEKVWRVKQALFSSR